MDTRTNQTTRTRSGEGYSATSNLANESVSTQVFLQPIAAPSILGLFGFSGATFMVAAHLAGWYGGSITEELLAPFAATFGGLAQFVAGMWAYKARDGLATAMHGMWGSFWIGFGVLQLLFATGIVAASGSLDFPALGYWFIVLAAITLVGAVAALSETMGLFSVLSTLAVGSVILAVGFLVGSGTLSTVGGWVLILSAILAFYTASALLLEEAFGQEVLPVGKAGKTDETSAVDRGAGEPGVKRGQ